MRGGPMCWGRVSRWLPISAENPIFAHFCPVVVLSRGNRAGTLHVDSQPVGARGLPPCIVAGPRRCPAAPWPPLPSMSACSVPVHRGSPHRRRAPHRGRGFGRLASEGRGGVQPASTLFQPRIPVHKGQILSSPSLPHPFRRNQKAGGSVLGVFLELCVSWNPPLPIAQGHRGTPDAQSPPPPRVRLADPAELPPLRWQSRVKFRRGMRARPRLTRTDPPDEGFS